MIDYIFLIAGIVLGGVCASIGIIIGDKFDKGILGGIIGMFIAMGIILLIFKIWGI